MPFSRPQEAAADRNTRGGRPRPRSAGGGDAGGGRGRARARRLARPRRPPVDGRRPETPRPSGAPPRPRRRDGRARVGGAAVAGLRARRRRRETLGGAASAHPGGARRGRRRRGLLLRTGRGSGSRSGVGRPRRSRSDSRPEDRRALRGRGARGSAGGRGRGAGSRGADRVRAQSRPRVPDHRRSARARGRPEGDGQGGARRRPSRQLRDGPRRGILAPARRRAPRGGRRSPDSSGPARGGAGGSGARRARSPGVSAPGRPTLEEARARLRELGYLDARVDRLLFRPVFAGRGGAFLPAILIGAFAAALAAVAAVEAAEPGFASSPASLATLFAHLFAASLLPAALLGLGLSWLAERARAPGASATLAGLAAALLVFALWIGGTYSLGRELSARALLWAIPIAVSALFLAAAVRLGFLARAFVRSGTLPRRAIRRVFATAAAVGLLTAILLFFSRHETPAAQAPQPSPRPTPVVVVAVDGLVLDGTGKDSTAAALLARGVSGWWPAERTSPPEIWTTLATGVPPSRHGVRALARVRPKPSPAALRPPFGTGWYLRHLGPALHLVVNAPVSSSDRRSLAFWEVAASSGIPSLSVGWWAAGRWPGATVVENRTIFANARDGVDADRVRVTLFGR